jgi:hypothetical protein
LTYLYPFVGLSTEFITILFHGADNQGGLVDAVGNFESKVAARAALELLRRLVDVERNKVRHLDTSISLISRYLDAQQYIDVFVKMDAKYFGKLKLFQHIKNDYNTGAFEIASLIIERLPAVGIEVIFRQTSFP